MAKVGNALPSGKRPSGRKPPSQKRPPIAPTGKCRQGKLEPMGFA